MSEALPSPNSYLVPTIVGCFTKKDFSEIEEIGIGGQGIVYKGYNEHYDIVAFKEFFNTTSISGRKEIDFLIKHARHPNIVDLFAVLIKDTGRTPSAQIGYVMKFMQNGSLDKIIHNPSKLYGYEQIFSWTQQIARGIGHLHRHGIIHRDVKPKNILLGLTLDDLKVSDFGTARILDKESCTTFVGTQFYMAPEVITESKYSFPSDVYSFTITLWEIIYREIPYNHLTIHAPLDKMNMVRAGERPYLRDGPFPEVIRMLLRGWLTKPEQRPSIGDFLTFAKNSAQNLKKSQSSNSATSPKLKGGDEGVQDISSTPITKNCPPIAKSRAMFTSPPADSSNSNGQPTYIEAASPPSANSIQRPKTTNRVWVFSFPKELGSLVIGAKWIHINSYRHCANVSVEVISPREAEEVVFKIDGTFSMFENVHAVCLDIWSRLFTHKSCIRRRLDNDFSKHIDDLNMNQFQQLLVMEEYQICLEKKGLVWTVWAFYEFKLDKGLDLLRSMRSFSQSGPQTKV